MLSRRDFLQTSFAAAAIVGMSGFGNWAKLAARQSLSQEQLLDFDTTGNVTLVHFTDCHAQTKPVWFREPSINIGVGEVAGKPPHISGKKFLDTYGIKSGTPDAYALSSEDFISLARAYGKVGGFDRVSTILKSIRSDRPDALFLDGGDTWHGSMTALRTNGQDMVNLMNALKPDAMTSHWEFTYGIDRVTEIVDELPFPFLGANIFDSEWDEPAYDSHAFYDRGGVKVAVIGQAFPYMPIANPRWMFPNLSFGIRENRMRDVVEEVRGEGAQLVVLLSHNGFDVDRKMASQVEGIDVILSGHTHDALPEPVQVGNTLVVASGSHGKFVSRLDLDVSASGVKKFNYRLIPVLSDVIAPDPEMTALVDKERAPFKAELEEVIGKTESLLYRRGNFNGTWDDLICQALLEEREADIALSPGFRWGPSLLPGDPITREAIFAATGMTYPNAYRTEMTGEFLHTVLEDVADNLFNPDPYYQQGGDMVRVGGMGYTIDVSQPIGKRITDMTLLKTGEKIDPAKHYVVSGWASVNEGTEGPPIYEVVENYVKRVGTVKLKPNELVKTIGG